MSKCTTHYLSSRNFGLHGVNNWSACGFNYGPLFRGFTPIRKLVDCKRCRKTNEFNSYEISNRLKKKWAKIGKYKKARSIKNGLGNAILLSE